MVFLKEYFEKVKFCKEHDSKKKYPACTELMVDDAYVLIMCSFDYVYVLTTIFSLAYHLRNEFDFWNVHGIMNTSVSCKVSEAQRASRSLCQRPEAFMIPLTFQKLNFLLIFTFYYKYLK